MRFSRVLKSKTKQSINTLQEILKINRLSTNELSGNLNSISYSKIFKGSTLEVPFSLGRTIRGVAFEEYELDPVSFCLSRQDMYNFDQEMFAKDFNNICVSENNKQVKDFISNINKKDILDFPVWAIAFPWEDNSFYNLKKNYLQLLIKNRKDYTKSSIVGENNKILDLPFALSHGVQYKNLKMAAAARGRCVAPFETGKPRSFQPFVPSTMLNTHAKPTASSSAAAVFERQVEFGWEAWL